MLVTQMPPRKRQIDVVFGPVMVSGAMRQLDRIVRAVADKDVTVTLIGESGTGKDVLARRVHELSKRRSGPFVPINCAAIPESLFESELFGHEKGAFTGASERARGKIEAAAGGTLFLDEIGEMPLGVQAKMLRFLEGRRFMRVGGSTKISVDTRLVCATLRPIDEEVKAGRFRADLFYRIQGISLKVPPLRERRGDIGPLVQQFVEELAARHGVRPPRIARATFAAFRAHEWPGNVRELRNVIEVLCLLREGKVARPRDLPEVVRQALASAVPQTSLTRGGDTLEVHLNRPLNETIEQILDAALLLEGGNRSRAARRLGVSLRTMQRHAARTPKISGLPHRREQHDEGQEEAESKDHNDEKLAVRRAAGDGFDRAH
jgi:DNA-binding NtrC family response regulator